MAGGCTRRSSGGSSSKRIERWEISTSELSRELGIARSLVQRWKHLMAKAGETAVEANEDVVPVSDLRAAQQRIRKLERVLGRKTMEVEILQTARDEVKKRCTGTACRRRDRTRRECDLSGARDRPREGVPGRHAARARYAKANDRSLVAQFRTVLGERATYGYRRATALVNQQLGRAYKRKRVRRVTELNGWTPPPTASRRNDRARTGHMARDGSNERWCSDSVQVTCWNGEVVEIGFALDCCDRECLAVVA